MKIRIAIAGFFAIVSMGAREPAFYPDKQDLLYYLDAGGVRHDVRSQGDWQKRRRDVLANMQLVMGPLPRIDHHLPVAVEVLREGSSAKYTWRRITYVAEPGDRAYAYLYVPLGLRPNHRAPAIVSLHGTGYLPYIPKSEAPPRPAGDTGDGQYAQELAERGYVVIAPDYLDLSPEYKTDPYRLGYSSGTMKGIVNHIRAVDVLLTLREVDRRRIGAVGLSLGGHNALFLASFDPRIQAVVSSAGFNAFPKYKNGNLKGWVAPRYMPRIASHYGSRPDRMPFDFTEILGVLAPRPVFVNAPVRDNNFDVDGVRDCVAAATPVYEKVFQAPGRLEARYPPGKHGFDPDSRRASYQFLDHWLKKR